MRQIFRLMAPLGLLGRLVRGRARSKPRSKPRSGSGEALEGTQIFGESVLVGHPEAVHSVECTSLRLVGTQHRMSQSGGPGAACQMVWECCEFFSGINWDGHWERLCGVGSVIMLVCQLEWLLGAWSVGPWLWALVGGKG